MTKMNTWARATILLVLVGCASNSANQSPPNWAAIPGANVTPFEQAQAVCEQILHQGQADVFLGGGVPAATRAMTEFRSCMAEHGWTPRVESLRAGAARQEQDRLTAEVEQCRTKNALTMLTGTAPACQPGDPGTEICSWTWNWHPSSAPSFDVPLTMTCILPQDGKPRDDKSCHVEPREGG